MLGYLAAIAAPLVLASTPDNAPPAAAPVATPNSAPSSSREFSAIEVFAIADRARNAGHDEEALRLYDALSQDQNVDVRAEAHFRQGTLLADLKRYREAATAFRALLDENPNAARVRLELARVLALMGNENGARRELRQAQASGLPEQVARAVGQFNAALRSQKRAGLTLEFALAPDTNINRATEVRTLDTIIAPLTLSRDARAQSGLGIHLAIDAYGKVPVSDGLSLVPRINSLATLYRQSRFNDATATTLIGLEWQGRQDRFTPSIGHGWRWYGQHAYMHTDVATLDWIHILGRRSQLTSTVSAATADYQLNDLQDGNIYSGSVAFERAFSARSGASMALNAVRQSARDAGYATMSGGVRLLGWHEAGHSTLFAAATLQRTKGDAALLLFGERRREWFASVRAGATLRALTVHGFAPYVRAGYERNASSVALYDYRRFTGEFGITSAF